MEVVHSLYCASTASGGEKSHTMDEKSCLTLPSLGNESSKEATLSCRYSQTANDLVLLIPASPPFPFIAMSLPLHAVDRT